MSHNNIGDEGINAIAETLGISQISELYVKQCGITPTGAISLSLVYKRFRILDMSENNIGDDGITAIAGALSNSQQIKELNIKQCGITLTGARSLAAGLLVNYSVRRLDVSENNISDDGITAIAGTLSNSQISELNISRCGITLTGARLLAAVLPINNSIKRLDVSGNAITVKGARLILKSSVNIESCQEVVVYDRFYGRQMGDKDYRHDDEVKMMMNIMEQRQQVGRCGACCILLTNCRKYQERLLLSTSTSVSSISEDDDEFVSRCVV